MKTHLRAVFHFMIAFTSGEALAESWSGTVVDIRSGQPIPAVQVYGGARGRVDLTPPGVTDAGGQFSVTYPYALDLNFWGYYMLTCTHPTPGLYFQNVRVNGSHATAVQVKMVPISGYIRGAVRDKATGQVLPNAEVSLGVPGAYWQTLRTDALGGFQFKTDAYTSPGSNYEEGIPTGEQSPHEVWQQVTPKTDYWLEVVASGYRTLRTSSLPLQINLLSSTSPDLHTFVTLEVVANQDTANTAAASAAIKNPYTEVPVVAITRAVRVAFANKSGVSYQFQRSATLLGPWENVGAPFVGDGTTSERFFDAETLPAQFYRVQVLAP